MKVQWETKRGSGLWGWDREFFRDDPELGLGEACMVGCGSDMEEGARE